MRRFIQKLFRPVFVWFTDKFSGAPQRDEVFKSLTKLYNSIATGADSNGPIITINPDTESFIIFSDQHKGTRGFDDDFLTNETNYTTALQYYLQQHFHFINLGDAEELWESTPAKVIEAYADTLKLEAQFQATGKYYRTYGNHDLLWKNPLDVLMHLKNIFRLPMPVYEGIVLRVSGHQLPFDIFCTHGHQGDKLSDNNAVSTWLVAHIWAPLQRFLQVNANTPSNDINLRNKHNRMMYEWSSLHKNLVLVTGHTHKPVFASGKYSDKAMYKIASGTNDNALLPSYFNTGCCCFNDGDITGIEISGGYIRLVKWHSTNNIPARIILEEKSLNELVSAMQS